MPAETGRIALDRRVGPELVCGRGARAGRAGPDSGGRLRRSRAAACTASWKSPADLVLGSQDVAVGVVSGWASVWSARASGGRLARVARPARSRRRLLRSASSTIEVGVSGRVDDDPVGLGLGVRRAGPRARARVRPHGRRGRRRSASERGHGITTVSTSRRAVELGAESLGCGGGEDDEADVVVESGPGRCDLGVGRGGDDRAPRRGRSLPFRGSRRSRRPCSYVPQDQHGDDEAVDGDALGEADHDHGPAEQLGLFAHGGQCRRSGVGDGDTGTDRRGSDGDGGADEGRAGVDWCSWSAAWVVPESVWATPATARSTGRRRGSR